MHSPSPPVVAGTFSGFIVGVLLALVITGVVGHSTQGAAPVATPTTAPAVAGGQMLARVTRIIRTQLGPTFPGQKYARLVTVQLDPVLPPGRPRTAGGPLTRYRSVYVVFNLNDHPLGRVWRLRAAKADVFGIMKALYTSGLPIYNVEMVGHFPEKNGQVLDHAMVCRGHHNVLFRG
ncbi:MAG: hypothetical protein LC772_12225 [Chloroflexi bacterium]|nr:hypothetical protein [Chloroflexota bacterium]